MSNQQLTPTANVPQVQAAKDLIEAQATREQATAQGMMVLAKQFPRDLDQTLDGIVTQITKYATESWLERATYAFPRGDTTVTGPSIRTAEIIAQNYGNLDFSITEISRSATESLVEAYCYDAQMNTRATLRFTVPHELQLKGGRKKKLTDPRDIYEMVMNQGSRRLRACIFRVVPEFVVDTALAAVKDRQRQSMPDPVAYMREKVLPWFERRGVKQAQVQEYIHKKIDFVGVEDVIRLRDICNAVKEGMSNLEDYFPPAEQPKGSGVQGQKEALKAKAGQSARKPDMFDDDAAAEADEPTQQEIEQELIDESDEEPIDMTGQLGGADGP